MNDYGPSNNKRYGIFLVLIDKLSRYGCTIPLKNKYAQTKTDVFSEIIKTSKRKPSMLETGNSKEYVNKNFNIFSKQSNIKRCSCYISRRAVFAERFDRTIRNPLLKPVFSERKL